MLFEKPKWVKHERQGRDVELCPLFSVDIDSTGQRLATAANDNKVRIWAMGPILDAQKEQDPSVPKLLATLTDHFEPVNVARFSPKGNLIASGSDSKLVVINQLMPGPASVRFGDKDAPSLENWKQMHVLRGHKSNVCDISWSPDGKRVASASLDNLVLVWDVASGRQVAVLEGHHGYVKGVAWDPFNMYIATQGENDGIFIWRVSDWSCVARVKTEFSLSADNSMHTRLSWSPDGQNIVGTCMVDKSTNTYLAPIIRRTSWDSIKQFTGHKLTISVAKFNPCHFYPRKEPGSDAATTLCALGSYDPDTQVTLWSSAETVPLLQMTDLFKRRAVMDVAWMPDGMSMVACSVEGTIAAFQFTEEDLGKKVPQHEVRNLLHSLYGDPQVRQRTPLADPELLKLQATNGARQGQQALASRPTNPTASGAANMGAANKLSSRMGPAGGVTEAGFAPPPAQAPTMTHIMAGSAAGAAGPSNQPPPRPTVTMEGGRKRIAPMPVGETAASAQHAARASQPPSGPSTSTQHPQGCVPSPPPVHLQQQPQLQVQASTGAGGTAAYVGSGSVIGGRGVGGAVPAVKRQALQAPLPLSASSAPHPHTQPLPSGGAVVLAGGAGGGAQATAFVLPPPPVLSLFSVSLGVWPGEEGGPGGTNVLLEAANTARDHRGRPASRLQCSRGGSTLWHDSVQGCVVQGAGGQHFSAISTSGGDLLLFSPAGRRMLPPIQLGCSAVVMAVRGWQLMVLTTDGRVRVWDVAQGKLKLEADAGPLLRGPAAAEGSLLTAKLTHVGMPVLIMHNHHAYAYHEGWACWMRVADDAFPASHFHSTFSSNQGMLGSVQAAVAGARQPRDVLAAANQPADVQKRAARAHLECNVASALAMQSPQEWRRWLVTYVRQLAADEDEARLKEILNELLGPIRWSPTTHGAASAPGKGWEPKIMGQDKRQILRYDVLREVSRVRSPSMQSLATQSLEALKEAEATVAAAAAEAAAQAAAAAAAAAAPASALPASPASGLGTAELQTSGDGLLGGGLGSQLAL